MNEQTPGRVSGETIAYGKAAMFGDPALGWAQVAGLVEIHADGSWKLTEIGEAGLTRVLEQVVQHPAAPRAS